MIVESVGETSKITKFSLKYVLPTTPTYVYNSSMDQPMETYFNNLN